MGHTVEFRDYADFDAMIPEQRACDFIDLVYRWDDANFLIIGKDKKQNRRGSHIYRSVGNQHVITLNRQAIESGFKNKERMGGNFPAPSLELAPFMILAHELQHANQSRLHRHSEEFYTRKKYNSRPCERDARDFVDLNMEVICSFLDVRFVWRKQKALATGDHGQEVCAIAELFVGLSEVDVADIVQELRLSGISNPKNVEAVTAELSHRGVAVRR